MRPQQRRSLLNESFNPLMITNHYLADSNVQF